MNQITKVIKLGKKTRTLKKIGLRRYGFNFEEEKLIYDYLCCRRMKRKDIKKVKHKFNTCLEWERYVEEKYKDLSYEDLYCFGKLLDQLTNECHMDYDMYKWIYPIILSAYFTKCFDYIQNFGIEIKEDAVLVSLLLGVLAWALIIFAVTFIIISVMKLLWMDKEKVDFCEDYSKMIDGMMKKYVKTNGYQQL